MGFEELEIRTRELIVQFDSIERRKKEILKSLESGGSVFDELNKLSNLLSREEIPLLKIVLQELEFIEERKRGLRRVAIRQGRDGFYWKVLERIERLRWAVVRFLRRAEDDASLVRNILFYWGHSSKRKPITKWIRKLIKSLKRDIKLEERLEEEDAYKILDDYLRVAESNAQNRGIIEIVGDAFKATNLSKMAACFLIALMNLGSLQRIYAAEPQAQFQQAECFTFPLKRYKRISEKFGLRKPPKKGASSFHRGIDIAADAGTSVYAIGKGIVFKIDENHPKAGKMVVIKHDNGYMSWYMHLSRILVKKEQRVDTSTIIGEVGSTGISTGSHLHLGISTAVSAGSRFIDPLGILKQ